MKNDISFENIQNFFESQKAENFFAVADVVVPNTTLDKLSFGIPLASPEQANIKMGSVVWVSLKGRKKPLLALVVDIHKNFPNFKLKSVLLHKSGFAFSESYVENVLWHASYYMCSLGESLSAFWTSDLEKYLDKINSAEKPESGKLSKSAENPPLTEEQQNALNEMTMMLKEDDSKFRGVLLHGITGSGKTRVYLELASIALSMEIPVLILVPEINLTPQTKERFELFLNRKIPILHSAVAAKEKRETWLKLLNKKTNILLGTRSAILAPFEPKLIIIDEEHDSSYKQQDPAPRYHCRETAFHIGHKFGAMVVLGSATPSIESWENARKKNLKLISMKERPSGTELPEIQIVDMKKQKNKQDKDLMLSPVLRETLCETVNSGNQAIILMNRRGYSTLKICGECGKVLECEECKVFLVHHKQYNRLLCHYCGRTYPINTPCNCGSTEFELLGGGIEKAEEEINAWIPNAKVLRLDSDTTQTIGAFEKKLQQFRDREFNVLLGTQMVAKGHDFPYVSLVGILCADIGSSLPDFRAGEKSFQILTQVAGRAGRSFSGATVILQTYCPENPIIRFVLNHDYTGFADWELDERRNAFYPPFCRIAQIKMQSKDKSKLEKAATFLTEILKQYSGKESRNFSVMCTEPFISMVQGKHRKEIMLKSPLNCNSKNLITESLKNKEFCELAKGVEIRVNRNM